MPYVLERNSETGKIDTLIAWNDTDELEFLSEDDPEVVEFRNRDLISKEEILIRKKIRELAITELKGEGKLPLEYEDRQ